jgi:hypothetical protein
MQRRHGMAIMWVTLTAVMSLGFAFLAPLTLTAAQDNPETITIALNEYKGSGVSGWATLTQDGSDLHVQMAVEGAAVTGNQPTHIHNGTCSDFDPNPLYPLTTFVLDPLSSDGVSESTVADVSLDDLLAGDYVILVHKSPEELTTYFVCGEIRTSNEISAPTAGAAGTVSMSATGSGSSAGSGRDLALTIGLALLATIFAGISFLLRRRTLRN